MPTGPDGQKRPASDVACATHVMKIATGEIKERVELPPPKRRKTASQARNGKAERPQLPKLRVGSGLPPLL